MTGMPAPSDAGLLGAPRLLALAGSPAPAGVRGGGPRPRGAGRGPSSLVGEAIRRPRAPLVAAAAASVAVAASSRSRWRPVRLGKVSPMREVPEAIERPPYLGPGQPLSPYDGFPQHAWEFDPDHLFRVEVKGPEQMPGMREAGALARETLEVAGRAVAAGVTTEEIDRIVHEFIISRGAYPSPLGYMGFPKACCTSVNDVIAHGIPDDRPLEDGDILNVDITVYLNGYHGDTSSMFFVGRPTRSAAALCAAGREAMMGGIKVCGPGVDFKEIGGAVCEAAAPSGHRVFPHMAGHGIGRYFHGSPQIFHTPEDVDQGIMKPGMTFTVEPVLLECNGSAGEQGERIREDGWTIQSLTASRAVQFEHTILITEEGHELLTGPTVDYERIAAEALGMQELEPIEDER